MSHAVMRVVLRSPLHGLVSRGLMLLTVTGRTSGRSYTFPVQYAEDDGTLLVLAGRATTKSWWRNVREPSPVRIRLRGRDVAGTARVVQDPEEIARGLAAYVRRFPRSAKTLGLPPGPGAEPERDAVARVSAENVIVRIELS